MKNTNIAKTQPAIQPVTSDDESISLLVTALTFVVLVVGLTWNLISGSTPSNLLLVGVIITSVTLVVWLLHIIIRYEDMVARELNRQFEERCERYRREEEEWSR